MIAVAAGVSVRSGATRGSLSAGVPRMWPGLVRSPLQSKQSNAFALIPCGYKNSEGIMDISLTATVQLAKDIEYQKTQL